MSAAGAGDRWMAGDHPEGVAFAHGSEVVVLTGPHAGAQGVVVLLLGLAPEPSYFVRLADGGRRVRVPQSGLRMAG